MRRSVTRRSAFAGLSAALSLPAGAPILAVGAAADAAILTGLTTPVSAEPVEVDAELIRICTEHVAVLKAINVLDRRREPEPEALLSAYQRTRDAISHAVPCTMAGIVAKAAACKAEAIVVDGADEPQGSMAEPWAWDLVKDLLRLHGASRVTS
jgi:hypothetical protein